MGGKQLKKLIALGLAIGLVAAACGDDGSPSSESQSGSTAPAGATATTVAASAVDPAGVLRYGAPFKLSKTFDPQKASLGQDNEWLFPAYDRLVHQSPNGDPQPGLAESWKFAADGKTLTLTIRSGVKFHDGQPLTAAAVKANLDRGRTLADSGVKSELATVTDVKVVDDRTVDLVLTAADAGLPLKLSDRAGAMISPAAFTGDDSKLATTEAGAGMYRLKEYVPGDKAVFEPFADYWDKSAVKLAGLEIIAMVDPAARFNAIRSGQINATILSAADADAAKSANLSVNAAPSLEVYYMGMNSNRSQFGNAKVRQAIMRAIDRKAMVDSLLFGLGKPAVQMFPPGYWANDPKTTESTWGYDLEAAKKLMQESGVAPFSFELIVPGPEPVPTAEALASQLSKIGITVKLRQVEPAQAGQIYTFNKESDAIIGPWSGRPDPSQTVGLLYLPTGALNVNGKSTPEIEQLAAKGSATFDQTERAKVYQDLSAKMTESALYVPLYVRERPYVSDKKVTGFVPYFSGKLEFRNVAIKK
jgi:peptide/nickel transport system substrate-binding protein